MISNKRAFFMLPDDLARAATRTLIVPPQPLPPLESLRKPPVSSARGTNLRIAARDKGRPLAAGLIGGVWGWFPVLSALASLGVVLLALADTLGREGDSAADLLFWLGLATIFLPIICRVITTPALSHREGVALVATGAIALTFVRILQYPTGFALNDEFQHWRTALDISASHHLFAQNPILPISPSFPGLELATNALSDVSGLSIFTAGMLIVAVARLLLILTLYVLYEQAGGSPRLAAIAALLYLANPSLLFDDGQYGYEALALPLGLLAILALARATKNQRGDKWPWVTTAALTFVAMVLTHHVSALLFSALLILWAAITMFARRGKRLNWALVAAAVIGIGLMVGQFVIAGPAALKYLSWYPVDSARQLVNLLNSGGHGRALFAHWGQPIPGWERAISLMATALTALGLALGWKRLWGGLHRNPVAVMLALVSLAYPLSLALRLVPAGMDGATRLMGWSFIGVSFVLASILASSRSALTAGMRSSVITSFVQRMDQRLLAALAIGCAGVVFLGGVVIGAGLPWRHTPGAYVTGGGSRAVTSEGIGAAQWAYSYLGPHHKIATDQENQLLMATYGDQNPETDLSGFEPAWIIAAPDYDTAHQQIVQRFGVEYIVVDRRFSTQLPATGSYFDESEPGAGQYTSPLSARALDKFDGVLGVNRVYDSGDIVIYGVAGE